MSLAVVCLWPDDAAAAQLAYVANMGGNTITVLDTSTNLAVATIPGFSQPHAVAINSAGTRVYVANTNAATVSVVDTATNQIVQIIPVASGGRGIAVNAAGTRVFAAGSTGVLSVIDTATNSVVGTGSIPINPHSVAVTPDGSRVYVVNNFNDGTTVSVLNTSTYQNVATVTVGFRPTDIAITPDGTKAYVANNGDSSVSVIATSTNTRIATIGVGVNPGGIAVNPAGTWVYVANATSGTISVINTSTDTVIQTITTSATYGHNGICVTPDGSRVYVASGSINAVTVINAVTNTVVGNVTVGVSPYSYGKFIGTVSALAATVATTAATSITATGASTGGNVTNDGGATVTQRGVVYGTSTGPTTGNATFITSGTGTGIYTVSLAGLLNQGVTYYVRAFAINSVGTSYGNEISFTTLSAPAITTQPASQTSATGGSATLTVVATGNPAVTYQWRKDGVDLSGATSTTLSLTNVQSSNAGSYTVVVSNSAGTVTSNTATLTVNLPPTIVTQPQGQSATAGANVSFSVTASGTTPFTYQWRKEGTAISGATNSTFSLGNVQSGDAASYSVVVSNTAGSVTSNGAMLTVTAAVVAPTITSHPQGQSVNAGASVAFTVTASGTTPFTYQWRKDGSNLAGATNSTFTLGNVQAAEAGIYTVVVGNSAGSTTSNLAVLTVTPVTATPTISAQPQSQSVQTGGSVTFAVTASGTAPLTYQWRKGNGDISGAINATLMLSNVQSGDGASYSVVVSNSAGSVNSNAATLTVTTAGIAPTITAQPESQTVGIGSNVTFRVAVSGTSPFTFQWRLNGAVISGATSDTLILGLVAVTSAGSYTVVVTNGFGSVTSSPATLSVIPAPTITAQLADQSVPVGANVAFTVTAAGAPPLSYQWNKDGRAITGATNSTLALTAVTDADAGTYRVVVTNAAGTAQSRVATLIVSPAVSKIINLSVRTGAGTGSETLIAGFVVAGQGSAKPLLLRGVGPSLVAFGVTGVLADPVMELYRGQVMVATNDNWGDSLDVDEISRTSVAAGAFPISERGRDAALFVRLQPASYSAQVGARAGTGIALIELYDTEGMAAPTRLVNVSARSFVGTGGSVLIAGFVIQGNTSKTVLVRGIGPTLAAFGVTGVLADPQLTLNKGNEVVASNDEWWRSGGLQALPPVFAAVGAFPLVNGTHDAAFVATLQPGAYTATLSGVEGGTGVALIEVYEVP